MNGESFNSERQQAEQFDKWITAAQSGGSPENDTVSELRQLVEIARAIRADKTFAHQLDGQLTRRQQRKHRMARMRWQGLSAAAILGVFLAIGIFLTLRPDDQLQPVEITPSPTSVALAATSTLAVEINHTESAISLIASATAALPTSAATTTTTPTPPPSATLLPPTPTLISATIIPAVNPTAQAGFYPVQIDVLFMADSNVGIKELENGIANLFLAFHSLPGEPDVRFGLLTMGEESIHTIDFTRDETLFLTALQEVETVANDSKIWSAMLNEAVTGMGWRYGATIKLIIGLADKRPDPNYTAPLQLAAVQGIVVDVIALGNVDEQAESSYREMTQLTGGHFVMLAGSDYMLNEWIGQFIVQELAALRSG